jgi:hypothetical protein
VKAALDEAGVQPAGPDTIVISAPPEIASGAKPEPVPAAVIEAEPAADAAENADLGTP